MGGSARAKTGRKGVKKGLGNLKMPVLAISDRSESENLTDFEVPDPSEARIWTILRFQTPQKREFRRF